MSIDPADDCTFWYTTEYLQADGSFNWSTQIASFALPSCTGLASTPDFALSASPSAQTVVGGGSASYTVTVAALNGFTAPVSLSAAGLPARASASFAPPTVTGSGTSTLTIATTAESAGSFTVTITGTNGSISHSTTVTLTVNPPADFSVSATPSSRTLAQGKSTTYAVTVGNQGGFGGVVSFAVTGLGPGATASFSPTSVSGSGSSTMTVKTASTAQTGTFSVTITGTSGASSHSTPVTLTVNPPPDFSISAVPGSNTVAQGQGTSYAVTGSPLNGFSASVTFSVGGLGSGTSVKFTPSSVTGAGSTTMTVTANSTAKVGTFALTITGTSGGLHRSTAVTLTVNPGPNFSISASPSSQTVTHGASTTYTVTVTGSGGFTGNVTLSVGGLPSSTTATFNSTSVTGSGTSTLTVSTTSQTSTGSRSLTIKGTSGSLNHSTSVGLIVN